MTTTEIAAEHGVSRQTIHTYRRTGVFPSPVEGEGSTRPRFREDEVVAFFEANPKQPRKKRRFPPKQQGETHVDTDKAAITDRWIESLQILAGDDDNPTAGQREEMAAVRRRMLDAYRSAVIREAADAVAQLIEEGEHDPDCLVDELRGMARRAPQGEEA